MPYPGWNPGYWKVTPLVSDRSQPTPGLVIGGGALPGVKPGLLEGDTAGVTKQGSNNAGGITLQ